MSCERIIPDIEIIDCSIQKSADVDIENGCLVCRTCIDQNDPETIRLRNIGEGKYCCPKEDCPHHCDTNLLATETIMISTNKVEEYLAALFEAARQLPQFSLRFISSQKSEKKELYEKEDLCLITVEITKHRRNLNSAILHQRAREILQESNSEPQPS